MKYTRPPYIPISVRVTASAIYRLVSIQTTTDNILYRTYCNMNICRVYRHAIQTKSDVFHACDAKTNILYIPRLINFIRQEFHAGMHNSK